MLFHLPTLTYGTIYPFISVLRTILEHFTSLLKMHLFRLAFDMQCFQPTSIVYFLAFITMFTIAFFSFNIQSISCYTFTFWSKKRRVRNFSPSLLLLLYYIIINIIKFQFALESTKTFHEFLRTFNVSCILPYLHNDMHTWLSITLLESCPSIYPWLPSGAEICCQWYE